MKYRDRMKRLAAAVDEAQVEAWARVGALLPRAVLDRVISLMERAPASDEAAGAYNAFAAEVNRLADGGPRPEPTDATTEAGWLAWAIQREEQ